MKNIKKRNHYIPSTYSKYWSNQDTKKFHWYRKDNKIFSDSVPNSLLFKKNFYSVYFDSDPIIYNNKEITNDLLSNIYKFFEEKCLVAEYEIIEGGKAKKRTVNFRENFMINDFKIGDDNPRDLLYLENWNIKKINDVFDKKKSDDYINQIKKIKTTKIEHCLDLKLESKWNKVLLKIFFILDNKELNTSKFKYKNLINQILFFMYITMIRNIEVNKYNFLLNQVTNEINKKIQIIKANFPQIKDLFLEEKQKQYLHFYIIELIYKELNNVDKNLFSIFIKIIKEQTDFYFLESDNLFITSDNPVISVNDSRVGEFVLLFPLSPKYLIIFSRKKGLSDKNYIPIKLNENQAMEFNKIIFDTAISFVISNSKEILENLV